MAYDEVNTVWYELLEMVCFLMDFREEKKKYWDNEYDDYQRKFNLNKILVNRRINSFILKQ